MKRVIWDVIDPKKIKAGDVVKWEQTCEECGHLMESSSVTTTAIEFDCDLGVLTVDNQGEEQIWVIYEDVKYLKRRQ